jgi:hypothetical protein
MNENESVNIYLSKEKKLRICARLIVNGTEPCRTDQVVATDWEKSSTDQVVATDWEKKEVKARVILRLPLKDTMIPHIHG